MSVDDIRSAGTPKGTRYFDESRLREQVEKVFVPSFHLLPELESRHRLKPFELMPGLLDEPLVLSRDSSGRLRCLSNVCTHRGMILCEKESAANSIRCGYHGRRFDLDGKLLDAPGFEGALNFPRDEDDLVELPIQEWGPLRFVSLQSGVDLKTLLAPLEERLGFLPLEEFELAADEVQVFEIDAHWELYVENYLEGFHVPWVHKGLAGALERGSYAVEVFDKISLQIGFARSSPAFALPQGHPDHGKNVAAYYFHIFPNWMINAYPWGLSVNVVEPIGLEKTRIRFLPYVWKNELRDQGAGSGLDRVEMEDEAVVESVHRGLKSRLYPGGRYAPLHEQAVFAFHRAMDEAMAL